MTKNKPLLEGMDEKIKLYYFTFKDRDRYYGKNEKEAIEQFRAYHKYVEILEIKEV